jgi:hypothetical protein
LIGFDEGDFFQLASPVGGLAAYANANAWLDLTLKQGMLST